MANDYNDLKLKRYHFMTLSMSCLASDLPLLLKKNTFADYKDRHIKDMTTHDSLFDLDTFH